MMMSLVIALALFVSGCLGFQESTQDRKGYFQKKEYIFRSLESQLKVIEKTPRLVADVTLHNPTNYSIEHLQLTCAEISKGGNHLGKHTPLLNQELREKSRRTFRRVAMGSPHSQFDSLQCEVTDFEIVGAQPNPSVPSSAGSQQKGGSTSGKMKMGTKESAIQERESLPASSVAPLPEPRAREGKSVGNPGSRPAAGPLSSQQKADLVLRLLRGESLESVSRDSRVSVYDLEQWQQIFLEEGRQGLEKTK